tara:strand:+ start:703 stop:1230 length:528 start_codon:yes stop_codon:yes gene_type:complete
MGKTTFSGPVVSLGGFNPAGYQNEVNVADATNTLSLTEADHGGRLLMLQDATLVLTLPAIVSAAPTYTDDPEQTNNLGLTFRMYFSVAATAFSLNTASADDEYVGAIQIRTEAVNAAGESATFFANGTDVSIDCNGGTKGGIEGSYLEVTATTDGWLCSKSMLLTGAVTPATPFA